VVLMLLPVAAGPAQAAPSGQRDVLVVSNNWDGTADLVDPRSFERLTRINVIPDEAARVGEINADATRAFFFNSIRQLIGEGNNQYVDDGFTSKDGRFVYFSRPSFADVVAINLKTRRIAWRVKVDGFRADHMALSPNGRRLLVSASTNRVIDVIDTRRGRIVGRIPSGDQPHENNYSRDGRLIFHGSIGAVYSDTDDPSEDATKGERVFEVIDARTLKVKRKINMGERLAAFGIAGMSSAVRPMAISPGERFVYFQLSFFHGFVEYDLVRHRVNRIVRLPNLVPGTPREQYLLDSAHHGIAMNSAGNTLCVAGTMSDYAAIVTRGTFRYKLIHGGEKPYWSTTSRSGRLCYVSWSGSDRISVINYETKKEIARIRVGDHPQRIRTGNVKKAWLAAQG
jgi:YVTN family beta-propeller protein